MEWNTRRIIELSDAVKCPWIGLQLANTKKVQQVKFLTILISSGRIASCNIIAFSFLQVLSKNGVLEKYITDNGLCARIRKTFAGMWGLEGDDDETRKIIQVSF